MGKYRVRRRIASGGFADVYEADDTIEGVKVALKLPHPEELRGDGQKVLLQEIRILASLKHPHIMPLKDAAMIDDRFVIAMPLSKESLEERMRRRLSRERALKYAEGLCAGLAHAHDRKIIHCDLKPQNLLLTDDDELRIADFGIAKMALTTRTVKGSGAGTVGYLAPEQPHGRLSARTDVFAAGLVLYELFSKELPVWPFTWPPLGESRIRERFSPDILRWLRIALSPAPKDRYKDGGEMLDALRVAMAQKAVSEAAPRATGKSRAPRVHAGLSLDNPEVITVPEGEVVVYTHRAPGARKGKNEDAVAVLRGKGSTMLVVADGAGGYAHGERAAATAVKCFSKAQTELKTLNADGVLGVLADAHQRVKRIGRRAGTTCSVVTIKKDSFRCFYAGDSVARVYSSRGHEVFRLAPHSPLGDAERSGLITVDKRTRKRERNVVSTLLGHEELRVEVCMWRPLLAGETLVLGTDGLWDNTDMEDIGKLLTATDLGAVAERLVEVTRGHALDGTGVADDTTFALFRKKA